MNKPNVTIKTFGCRSNFSDTIDLASRVEKSGGVPHEFENYNLSQVEQDNYLIINTCTVTDTADAEALKFIEKALTNYTSDKIIITGCMAEASKEKLSNKFPGVKVISPNDRNEIINEIFSSNKIEPDQQSDTLVQLPKRVSQKKNILKRPHYKFDIENLNLPNNIPAPGGSIGAFKFRSRFHLRIQEGCENHCTFCIIPSTRGHLSSKSKDKVIEELKYLEQLGYNEIVLTGTHLGGYGLDIGTNLLNLLIEIDKNLKTTRVRLSSLDPDDISFEMIDFISQSNTYCNHLHICFQAFNDRILKRMNRKYSLGEAEDLVWYLDQQYKKHKTCNYTIGSDSITGFPGESRKDLEEGIKKFVSLPLSYLHVFPYSERVGTAATRLDGSVSLEERKERSKMWRKTSDEKFSEHAKKFLGTNLDVIVESKKVSIDNLAELIPSDTNDTVQKKFLSTKEFLLGTTSEYLTVALPVLDTEKKLIPGQRLSVNAHTFIWDRQLILCEY